MTEEKEVYFEDLKQKNDIKKSAFKKNRTGKGPLRFPSDYKTKKEREAMNGECRSWNLNGFYSWDEFKKMPDDIKITWLNRMLNKFGVRLCDISKIVFHKSDSHLANWLGKNKEIHMYINVPKRGAKIKQSDLDIFTKAVETWRTTEVTLSEKPVATEDPSQGDDWTSEERDFISRYIAPLSEPKKVEPKEAIIKINPEEVVNSTSVTEETDDSILYAFTPAELPKMSHMEFGMDGFDMDFLRMIAQRFGDQKIRVCVSVYVEKSVDE